MALSIISTWVIWVIWHRQWNFLYVLSPVFRKLVFFDITDSDSILVVKYVRTFLLMAYEMNIPIARSYWKINNGRLGCVKSKRLSECFHYSIKGAILGQNLVIMKADSEVMMSVLRELQYRYINDCMLYHTV